MHVHAPADPAHSRSYARVATRRLLRDWAVAQDQVIDAIEDTELEGVPVAVLARLDNESEVALCYVDMKLGADAWQERNGALRALGLTTSWIFALRKMYFAPPDPAELVSERDAGMDLILDQPIYRRMRGNGSWPLLINLERQELGNVIKPDGGPARRLRLKAPDYNRVQHFVAYGLSSCHLCRYGIATPAITETTLKLSYGNWRH